MAEAFGAAAGVFGVVSMIVQLAESVQRVKSFYANFKDACPRLADHIEEIGDWCNLMEELQQQIRRTGASPNLQMLRCLNSSRNAAEYFAKFTGELESYAKKRRIRGGLKFALSQNEIKRMLNRVERAKGLLAMVYIQHQSALQQQYYESIIQAKDKVIQQMKSATTAREAELTQLSIAKAYREQKPMLSKRIFEIRTPEWLNNKIWQLALDRSISGWEFTMRTYGVVSQSDPIINACGTGNTLAMQRLFDTGAASPFDRTSEGFDLISYGVLNADINTLRFLLRYGVTSNTRPVGHTGFRGGVVYHRMADRHQISYGLFWMCSLLHDHEEATIQEDVQFLLTNYDDDDMRTLEDIYHDRMNTILAHSSPEKAVSLRFWRSVYHVGLTQFRNTTVVPSITNLLERYDPSSLGGKTQLQLLAAAYGRALAEWLHYDQLQSTSAKDGLEQFIKEAIALKQDVHEGFNDYTPLKIMLCSFTCFWDRGGMIPQSILRKALIAWCRLLESARVDLCGYGKEEMRRFELRQFSQTPGSTFEDWYRGVLEQSAQWTGPGTSFPLALSCGPDASDWHVVLLGFAEECSREFWQMVDAQIEEASYRKYVAPGGWFES